MPAAFGLSELKKGYFPHFNTVYTQFFLTQFIHSSFNTVYTQFFLTQFFFESELRERNLQRLRFIQRGRRREPRRQISNYSIGLTLWLR